MMEIFCFDCSCVLFMPCIICQNSNSLISTLCSSLCNLYLNTTFWKGKKKSIALKLCSKSQEGMCFCNPLGLQKKKQLTLIRTQTPSSYQRQRTDPRLPLHLLFLFYPNKSHHFSLLYPKLQKHLLQQCSKYSLTAQGCRVLYPVIMESDPEVQPRMRKKVYYCCQWWSQFLLDTSSYKLSSYTC